ncbi:hypothetical protein ACWD01_36600 [Streptomyces sp. NPDC002835]
MSDDAGRRVKAEKPDRTRQADPVPGLLDDNCETPGFLAARYAP